jgi:phage shock protein PspC (stress-responsive transcriptional regulator)
MEKKLYRSRTDKKLCGVCGGLAKYLNMDATIIRLIVVLLTLAGCSGLLIYIIAALIIPEEPLEIVDENPTEQV